MSKCIYLILLTGLMGYKDLKPGYANSKNLPVKQAIIDTADQYIDGAKLNGVISARDTRDHVFKYLGKPDKMSRYYDFKGVQFLYLDHNLILTQVWVAKFHNLYLQTTKLKMNYNTSINDFQKYYPKYANDELSGTDMDKTITIAIPQKKTKNLWWFEFDRNSGKLRKIDFEPPDF